MKTNKNLFSNVWAQRILIMAVLLIIMAIFQRSFFSLGNLRSILMAISIYGIMSCGMLLVMLVGGIDLALGSTAALTSCIAMYFYNTHGSTDAACIVGILLALLVACVIGIFHGVCDSYIRLPAFVVTLATSKVLYGIASGMLDNEYVHLTNTTGLFYKIGNARLLNIPMPIIIFVVIAIIVGVVMGFTVYGRKIYGVGSNRYAAEVVGINSKLFRISCYIICSITACIGGIVLSSMNLVTSSVTAQGYETMVMLALVVGGADIMGGYGDIGGAVYGALLAGIINNMLVLLNVDTNYSNAVQGMIIVLAVAFNVYNNRKSAGMLAPKKNIRSFKSPVKRD